MQFPPQGNPWNFLFFCDFQKGLAWCLSRALLYVASGVERKERAFFSPGGSGLIEAIRRKWGLGVGLSAWGQTEKETRGKWIHRSNPQEVGPGGGSLPLGREGIPPTFAAPRGVALKKGTFPFTLFWFLSLFNGDFNRFSFKVFL